VNSSTAAEELREERHPVTISVNGRPVNIEGPRDTGAEIKAAAIVQGVPIQPDFILSEELPDHRTKVISDSDIVTVTEHSRFVAVAPDDNS
jgi:cell division protein ZapA (FtsZ GTPase activity inhibitor)